MFQIINEFYTNDISTYTTVTLLLLYTTCKYLTMYNIIIYLRSRNLFENMFLNFHQL